jgi:hypothetical protein
MLKAHVATALFLMTLCGQAAADDDVARITWGRVTNPEHSVVLQMLPQYVFSRMSDPTSDSAAVALEGAYALSDGLTLSAVLAAHDTMPRGDMRFDRAGPEVEWRVHDGAVQLALVGVGLAGFDGATFSGDAGVRALRRWGHWIGTAQYSARAERDATWTVVHSVDVDGYMVFGTDGVLGGGLGADHEGNVKLDATVGGRINNHLFLGVNTSSGLTGDAPALACVLQLQVYFGPYYSAGLE